MINKLYFLILILLFSVDYVTGQCLEIYAIRHAEKADNDPKDPDLSEKGLLRAESWVKFFEFVPFDEIYASQRKRTQQTATPISKSRNLEIQEYKIGNEEDYIQKEWNKNSQKILWVGHSNSIPKFVGKLMNKDLEHIDENNFGQFWLIQYCPKTPEKNSFQIFQLP